MAHELITSRKLVFRYLGNDVRSGTVVDHFRLSPNVRVCRRLMIPRDRRDSFRSLLAAANHRSLTIGTDLDVITRPQLVFGLAVATLADGLHHHFIELRLQGSQFDSILWPLRTSNARYDRVEIKFEHGAVIAVTLARHTKHALRFVIVSH